LKPKLNARIRNACLKKKRIGIGVIGLLILSVVFPVAISSPRNVSPYVLTSAQSIPSAEVVSLNLSYTSRTNLIDTPVKSGDTIAGDHVVLKSEWTPSLVTRTKLVINAPAIPAVLTLDLNQPTLQIDTRALGNNASCIITSTAWLTNGSIVVVQFTDVYIGNFFVPKVRVIAPNGGEDWTSLQNITWTASDVNADSVLRFDVMFSDDSGKSFETLASSLNQTWFEWDCSNLLRSNTYIVRIRVTDGIFYNSDKSDGTFTAGTIVTTTTTSTTAPPTTTPGLEPRILAFVAILLFSSGVMALVVYYAARKWF
jgi:hypothetical protein